MDFSYFSNPGKLGDSSYPDALFYYSCPGDQVYASYIGYSSYHFDRCHSCYPSGLAYLVGYSSYPFNPGDSSYLGNPGCRSCPIDLVI